MSNKELDGNDLTKFTSCDRVSLGGSIPLRYLTKVFL